MNCQQLDTIQKLVYYYSYLEILKCLLDSKPETIELFYTQ